MKINKHIILLLFLLFAGAIHAQVSETEYKAAFVERFTRFVEWPQEIEDNDSNHTFKIAVIGKNTFKTSLDELFAELKIKNKNVEIIYTYTIKDLRDVNLVFISASEKKRIHEILAFTDKYPILTIGDTKEFSTKGGHINMYVDDNYIRYEINQIAIKKSGLKVSSLLLNSAKIVETDD